MIKLSIECSNSVFRKTVDVLDVYMYFKCIFTVDEAEISDISHTVIDCTVQVAENDKKNIAFLQTAVVSCSLDFYNLKCSKYCLLREGCGLGSCMYAGIFNIEAVLTSYLRFNLVPPCVVCSHAAWVTCVVMIS